jgi:hypothetical protein
MDAATALRGLQRRFRSRIWLSLKGARRALRERHARAAREWQAYLDKLRSWRQACAEGYRPCACCVRPDGESGPTVMRALEGGT